MTDKIHLATRRLTHKMGSKEPILLVLEPPHLTEENNDWACPFKVVKEKDNTILFQDAGYGVDSLQAFITAIDAMHYALKQHFPDYQWITEEGSSGVPRTVPMHLPAEYTSKITQYIDQQLELFLKDVSSRKK